MCRPWAAQGLKESGVYFINYVWLCRLLVAVCGLSLVAAGGGYSSAVVHGLLKRRGVGGASFTDSFHKHSQP